MVQLFGFGFGPRIAGGSSYADTSGGIVAGTPITTGDLASCGYGNPRNLTQDGVQGSYEADDYHGFAFRAEDPFDGLTYDYEFAIVGQVSTVPVITKVLVTEPTDEDRIERTQEVISQFLNARVNHLINSQPNLVPFLSDAASGSFSADVTQGRGTFNFASKPENPVWVRSLGAADESNAVDSTYFFGAIGSHFYINPNVILGGMLQVDYLEQDDEGAEIEGYGWMIGPYIVAQLPGENLFFEGRLLYGQSSNEVSPLGTFTDDFDTERFLVQAKVAGVIQRGETSLIPSFAATYASDRQKAYVDSLGGLIPEQEVRLAQMELGLGFETPVPFETVQGDMILTGGVSAIGSFYEASGTGPTVLPDYEGGRARIELGMRYSMKKGGQLVVETFYDGIGANGYQAYGAQVGLNMQF